MKKIVALVLAAMMLLACTAFAEPTLLADYGTENTMVFDKSVAKMADGTPTGTGHMTAWNGEWVLVAAYMSEDGIEEFEFEDVEPGYYAVPGNAVKMTLKTFQAVCNTPDQGPIVHDANYWKYYFAMDMAGTIVFAEDICDETYEIDTTWKEFNNQIRANQDADVNFGPGKVYLDGEDDYLHWNELTGFDFEEIEEFKYVGLNMDGQLVLCSATKNLATNSKAKVMFAYIFEKVVPEEVPAE